MPATTTHLSLSMQNLANTLASARHISRSQLFSTMTIDLAYRSGIMPPQDVVRESVMRFPSNERVSLPTTLRANTAELTPEAAWDGCAFYAALNLDANFRVSGRKSANLYKNEQRVAFFAVHKIRERLVSADIPKMSHLRTPFCIGSQNLDADREYYYFSSVMNFVNPNVAYPLWGDLLAAISHQSGIAIPADVNLLKVSHTELMKTMLPALQMI